MLRSKALFRRDRDPILSAGPNRTRVARFNQLSGWAMQSRTFLWPLGQDTIRYAHRGPHSNFFLELVHVPGVLAKQQDGRGSISHGSGGRRRTMSPTWLEVSLCNASVHVFWQHGRTLGVCEVQPCEGRVFFSFRWLETGGLCIIRAGNEDACCI